MRAFMKFYAVVLRIEGDQAVCRAIGGTSTFFIDVGVLQVGNRIEVRQEVRCEVYS